MVSQLSFSVLFALLLALEHRGLLLELAPALGNVRLKFERHVLLQHHGAVRNGVPFRKLCALTQSLRNGC